MIYLDVTKAGNAGHRSGLVRVTTRLREQLGKLSSAVSWPEWRGAAKTGDWFLTAEVFSPEERAGFADFLKRKVCRCAAIFHDAIPMRYPHTTWPQSVARHPSYLKMLASFDRVWAVSHESRDDLEKYWRWLGLEQTPRVEVLALGADFDGTARVSGNGPAVEAGQESGRGGAAAARSGGEAEVAGASLAPAATPGASPRAMDAFQSTAGAQFLCVGIVEPRKNQLFLLEVCAGLWESGLAFELHLVGRTNPHFGAPIAKQVKKLGRKYPGLHYHPAAGDDKLASRYAMARATLFPTQAEGCGLPLLESLWMGVPCVASDLAVLRENALGGGCCLLTLGDHESWAATIRRLVEDDAFVQALAREAKRRVLPTWAGTAEAIIRGLREPHQAR